MRAIASGVVYLHIHVHVSIHECVCVCVFGSILFKSPCKGGLYIGVGMSEWAYMCSLLTQLYVHASVRIEECDILFY